MKEEKIKEIYFSVKVSAFSPVVVMKICTSLNKLPYC